MTGFYAEMQEMASELLAEFKQGVVSLNRTTTGEPDPATPWEPGADGHHLSARRHGAPG